MNAVSLISHDKNHASAKWQFDKVMSAIAYDMNVSVVFMGQGCSQILDSDRWNCLSMFGVENIYLVEHSHSTNSAIKSITFSELKSLIAESDIVL